jgi:hypothetical protein
MRSILCLLLSLGALRAHAFGIEVHERFARYAFAKDKAMLERPLPPLSQREVGEFWKWLRAQALAALPEAARTDLERRWPEGDRAALKILLGMNPAADVYGIDRSDDAADLGAELGKASAHPDVDLRDRDRIALGPDGRPLVDRFGEPVPDDPAILNMGTLRGLSSQASAHYGLLREKLSDDPDVLKSDPAHFAIARTPGVPEVLTFAPERAQLHADLAVLAGYWNGPGAARLSALFTGAGWHYLQDVGSQVHTVQVGLYDFFVRAKILYWLRAALTAGGYFGELRSFGSIGITILSNHHIFVESLGARRLLDAEGARAGPFVGLLREMAEPSGDLPSVLPVPRYPLALCLGLIARSAPEGADVYRAAAETTRGELRSTTDVMGEEESRPDHWIRSDADAQAALSRLYDLVRHGFLRVATAMREWWRRQEIALSKPSPPAIAALARRFFEERLAYRGDAEARRARYLAAVTAPESGSLHEPVWIAIDLALLAFLALLVFAVIRLVRRLRRRRT